MKIEQVKEIANAILYEGYLLYPYRRSAIKNRQRWTFGVLYPHEYSEANGGIEPWMMRTECLLTGQQDTTFAINVRFLHLLVHRETSVACHEISAKEEWEEGLEREINVMKLSLADLLNHPLQKTFAFPGKQWSEKASEADETEIVYETQTIAGRLIITAEPIVPQLFKLCVQIENTTPATSIISHQYKGIVRQSFVSTHTIIQIHTGSLLSLMEPPEMAQAAVEGCQNVHTWPVLVGKKEEHDTILSSPIILYDYPQIAPESSGALFDGTEIEEILTLRIMTLTDEEKEQMRRGDVRAREILERTEALSPEQFMKLHGVIRSLCPINEGEEV